jgi:proteasome ATPase
MADIDQHIEAEVARRTAALTRRHNDVVQSLRDVIKDCQNKLVAQNARLVAINTEPSCFGKLIKVYNHPDPRCFKANDEVVVIDPESPYHLEGGRIISGLNNTPVVDDDGCIMVKLFNGSEGLYSIGLEGQSPAEVRLANKPDGTFAVVNIDGKPWEVHGVPDLGLTVGQTVKIKPDTKAILSGSDPLDAGPICRVLAMVEEGVEVMNKGDTMFVFNPKGFELEEGDRVVCDKELFSVVKKLERDNRDRYKVSPELNVTWEDVGGLETAKSELKDALELPFQQPDLYAYYNVDPLCGVLLYGPPGCGKTLLARVCAWSMAVTHGKEVVDSGYIFIKGPEILDKWVGNTEAEIRELFERGRRHFREHGYKGILAVDESDAILAQRGMRVGSSITETVVPMFLGEMDGIDEQQTRENPIVILMTNRPDILDPAVTRPGRISRHIKIERPDEMNAIDILDIHTKDVPFQDPDNRMASLAITCSDLFSKGRLLYRVNNEHDFTLGDAASGAMLASIAESAKMLALHRDLAASTQTGIGMDDLREAVTKIYHQQRGLNHSYDLQDFAEKLGIQPKDMKIDRCFAAA